MPISPPLLPIKTVVDIFVDVLESMQLAEKEIVGQVNQFINEVIENDEAKENRLKSDLFQYIVAMVLFMWKNGYNLRSVLQGLHKQSIISLHEYLCPDLKTKINESTLTHSSHSFDPYKQVSEQLQQLSETTQKMCRFCHKESIFSYISAQTRSADEGMTTFVTCSLCGKIQRM